MSGLTKLVEMNLVSTKVVHKHTLLTTSGVPVEVLGSPPPQKAYWVRDLYVNNPDASTHDITISVQQFGDTPVFWKATALGTSKQNSGRTGNLLLTPGAKLFATFATAATLPLHCNVNYTEVPLSHYSGWIQKITTNLTQTLVSPPPSGTRSILGTSSVALRNDFFPIRVYNSDSITHTITFEVGGTTLMKKDVATGDVAILDILNGASLVAGQTLTCTLTASPTNPVFVWVAWEDNP